MNYSVTVESLIEKFIKIAGPVHDVMINARMFLMRNSEWSWEFLRLTHTETKRSLFRRNV